MQTSEPRLLPAPTTRPLTVEEHLDRIQASLRHEATAYEHHIEEGLSTFQAELEAARHAHDAARQKVERVCSTTDEAHTLWNVARNYLTLTQDGVWTVLREALAATDFGSRFRDASQALTHATDTLPSTCPDVIERPEPDDVVQPTASDGLGIRMAKGLVRTRRAIARPFRDDAPRTQTVPLATLVERHLHDRVRQPRIRACRQAEQTVARWLANLERQAQEWTHQALEIERRLDAAWHHHDSPTEDLIASLKNGDNPAHLTSLPGARATAPVLVEQLLKTAEDLDACLETGMALSLDDAFARLRDASASVADKLAVDVHRIGILPRPRRPQVSIPTPFTPSIDPDDWPDWYAQVEARLTLLETLCDARTDTLRMQQKLARRATSASIDPLETLLAAGMVSIDVLRHEADEHLDVPEPGATWQHTRRFERFADAASRQLDETLFHPLEALTPRRSMRDVVQDVIAETEAFVDEQQATFTLHPIVPITAPRVDPSQTPDTIAWHDLVDEAYDELLFDAWKAAIPALAERIDAVRADTLETRAVMTFHLGAAIEELQDRTAAARRGELDASETQTDPYLMGARELALGGIDRSRTALETGLDRLDGANLPFVETTWVASTRAWASLHDRIRTLGQTRALLLRFESWLEHAGRDVSAAVQQQARSLSVNAERSVRRVWQQITRLVKLGQSAVGPNTVDDATRKQTIEALSTIDETLSSIPLVYRRLFSFHPVQDPDLLVGRAEDLAAIDEHAQRWLRGLRRVLVLTSSPGAGLTSLLNTTRRTVYRAARIHTIDLTDRVQSEADLARRVADGLGLTGVFKDADQDADKDPDKDAPTLDALAEAMMAKPPPDRLHVCFVERLEHTFLRTIGGTDRLAAFLSFLSETDSRVLWVATCSSPTWQFIETGEPEAARLVDRHDLRTLTRDDLEQLIMSRHRRSGLEIVFESPTEKTHPLLTRRLRVTKDEATRQSLIRAAFFDELYQRCNQNVMLALFYWIRSVHVEESNSTIYVDPLQAIRFDELDSFKLPLAFALKALVEHATLTVAELATVLQISDDTARAMMETLGNAQLIAPVDPFGFSRTYRFVGVVRDVRYRLRPLVLFPVLKDLRSRNVLH